MARGWESKSVEAQQAEAAEVSSPARAHLTPAQIARLRQRDGLVLSRKHVSEQLRAAHYPRHRQMLEKALADLETKIADLDAQEMSESKLG